MTEVKLEKPRDLDILLAGLYSQPVKGLETLRLFDKVLTEIEKIAVVRYDENGNIVAFDPDGKTDENGNLKRATYLKEIPCTLRLEDGHAAFLRARIANHDWPGQVARDVMRILVQLEGGSDKTE